MHRHHTPFICLIKRSLHGIAQLLSFRMISAFDKYAVGHCCMTSAEMYRHSHAATIGSSRLCNWFY